MRIQDLNITLTGQQNEALRAMVSFTQKPHQPLLTVGGYAGTGKTTLISLWRKVVKKSYPKLRVGFVCYTGKASRVLAHVLKNNDSVGEKDSITTIHGLIYAPIKSEQGIIIGWKRRERIQVDMVVVDEASMVDEVLFTDLLTFDVPIIAVGDHGQLPPISEAFNLMEKPIIELKEIHRQAIDNPIIDLSVRVRNGETLRVGTYGPTVKKLSRYDYETGIFIEEKLQNYSQDLLILVGYNMTRLRINQTIREKLGFDSNEPQYGDVVICLKNNWTKGIYNGMLGQIEQIRTLEPEGNSNWYEAHIRLSDTGEIYTGKVNASQFNHPTTLRSIEGMVPKDIGDLFDFGYTLTVHKAQGGQATEVLLFEERNKYMNDEDWSRWLYTGITRAQERLTIVGTD